MKTIITTLTLAALCQASHAADLFSPMSDAAWERQALITAVLLVDHHQTQEIRKRWEAALANPGTSAISEANPLIRRHFSESGVRNYFVASAITSAVVTKALPAQWRATYQYSHLALQVATVIHNKRLGFSVAF